MKGKVVVITGVTSGIGLVAAQTLASMGARIVGVARDRDRGDAALSRLRQRTPRIDHTMHYANLSELSEVRRVAKEIADAEPRIDVLMNNAGALFGKRETNSEGLELTFVTNHLAYFLFTHELRNRLQASAPSRIVNTASRAHQGQKLDFDDLQATRGYGAFQAYSRSKLCNILFTRELARRLAGTGVTANSLHPGFVATRFADQAKGMISPLFRFLKLFAISPAKGAETMVYLASSGDVANVTGEYFSNCKIVVPSNEAQDDESVRRLWRESARLTGVGA